MWTASASTHRLMVNNKSQNRYEITPPLQDLGPAPGNNRALPGMTAWPSDYFEGSRE